jgi:hemoglobin
MSFEYIRYRFRLQSSESLLELAQVAALKSLRHSPRCRSWRVLPAPNNPTVSMLAIEWDPGPELTPFRGSEEFSLLHAALEERVRALEEADYRADTHLLRRLVGGTEALFRLAEDIVTGILMDPFVGPRFQSADGSKRGRLGLWLLEVLGGPDLFSSSFPEALAGEGPLHGEYLDLDDRDRVLEIARKTLPSSSEQEGRCVVGTLRACLPLHPAPPSKLRLEGRLLPDAEYEEDDDITIVGPAPVATPVPLADSDDEPASQQLALYTQVRHVPTSDTPVSSRLTPRGPLPASPETNGEPTQVERSSRAAGVAEGTGELLPTGTEDRHR